MHFINAEWKLVEQTVALKEFSDAHTAENITKTFDTLLDGLKCKKESVNTKPATSLVHSTC